MKKNPPFQITNTVLTLSSNIALELGILMGAKLSQSPIKLRKENKIKTIQASLAIEGNTLTLNQVSALLEGKRVIGPQADIQEVNNAILVYKDLTQWNPISINSFKKAHKMLMNNLITDNGMWRVGGVGILKGKAISHIAPPASRIIQLMEDLFVFIKENNHVPWLIKACVFHYELEFIHPFSDGNGRMGRLWQQLLLMKENSIFEFIPVESIIKENQMEYYAVLESCDKTGDSTTFIEFSLEAIYKALQDYTATTVSKVIDFRTRLDLAKVKFELNWFSRKDYLTLQKDISTATASRDLAKGLREGMLESRGEKNQAQYKFTL